MYKVLIVEDEPILIEGLRKTIDFESLHCEVCGCAMNGIEGFQMIRALQPDIVITDLRMPEMDGIEMLKKAQEYKHKTIIISGYEDFHYAKQAISLNVENYLLKPIDTKELKDSIMKIVKDLEYVEEDILAPEIDSPYIKECLNYIHKNYREQITLSDMANHLQISNDYLSRLFKKELNSTVHQYLKMYRINQACRLMIETDKKVYEIGLEVGFNEYKYFFKTFSKIIHISPTQYRKRMNKVSS